MNILRLILATIKKSILNQSGYKLMLFYVFWGSFLEIIIYFFTNKFVDLDKFEGLTGGVTYFSFIVIGYSFADLFTSVTMGPVNIISQERVQGTFESYVRSPYRLYTLLFVNSIPEIIQSITRIFVFILIGAFLGFRVNSDLTLMSLVLFLLLSVVLFFSVTMIITSLTLIDRRFRHLMGLYISVSITFSGAFYPVEFLPDFIYKIMYSLPFGFTMTSLRKLQVSSANIAPVFTVLIISILLTLIASYFIFNRVERFSMKKGTILKY